MEKKQGVAIVVGRFQVPKLHTGHEELFDYVFERHSRVVVVLGLSHSKCSFNNPYDFACRQAMFMERYPDITCLYINNVQDDKVWSSNLDDLIEQHIGPGQDVILYGSRDSFISKYYGVYKTSEFVQRSFESGTDVRHRLSRNIVKDEKFRLGVNWAVANQWPGPMLTIDVAIFNHHHNQILLGRKRKESGYRIIGGFVQNRETAEYAVLREAKEETGVNLHKIKYVRSFVSTDWRFAGERDKILTLLHTAEIKDGRPEPNDDIHELRWFDFDDKLLSHVISDHKEMIQALLDQQRQGGESQQ